MTGIWRPEDDLRDCSSGSVHFIFLGLEFTKYAKITGQGAPREVPVSASPVLGWQVYTAMPRFSHECCGWIPSPCPCDLSALTPSTRSGQALQVCTIPCVTGSGQQIFFQRKKWKLSLASAALSGWFKCYFSQHAMQINQERERKGEILSVSSQMQFLWD